MKIFRLLVVTLILTLVSCGDNSELSQLKKAYSFLDNDSLEEAEMIVNLISDSEMNQEAVAMYNLTLSRLRYMQYKEVDDSLINFSINYYKDVNPDKYLLEESYFYKGSILYSKNEYEEATKNLKEAEIIATELKNTECMHKIYEVLCIINYNCGYYDIGFSYAQKVMQLAKKEKNYNWYVYAADYMATYYHVYKNNPDSANYYIESIKPYAKKINKDDLAVLLANLADVVKAQDPDLAISYLKQSLEIKRSAYTYRTLSTFYLQKNEIPVADSLMDEALKIATLDDSIFIYQYMVDMKKYKGDFQEALRLYEAKELLTWKSSELSRQHDVMRVQAQYNVVAKEKQYQSNVQRIILGIVLLIVIIVIILFFYTLRLMKMKKDQIKDQLLIEVYNNKIKDLETSELTSTTQVEDLKNKVTQLQQKQGQRLSDGKKLYEHILAGGSIITWEKQDYSNLFDYYNLVDMPFMVHMEKDYDNLSSRHMLYLILCNMGKKEEEMEKIFGISNSSLRSIKSRTKSRKKNKEE